MASDEGFAKGVEKRSASNQIKLKNFVKALNNGF